MRAGLLDEFCTVYGESRQQSASGFIKRETVELARVRCHRINKREKAAVAANEEQLQGQVTLQLRDDARLRGATSFNYDGEDYHITQTIRQRADKSLELTGQQIQK
jgi:hypothetical protein